MNDAEPGTAALFTGFATIGLCGFGGVLPWARRVLVDRRCWLTAAEFTDLLALCQFLPGPNIVNFAVCYGGRQRGVAGALAAISGLLVAPVAIVIGLGALFDRYGAVPVVANAVHGLSVGGAGLIASVALRIAAPARASLRQAGFALAAFLGVVWLKIPLLAVMAVVAPVSILVAMRGVR